MLHIKQCWYQTKHSANLLFIYVNFQNLYFGSKPSFYHPFLLLLEKEVVSYLLVKLLHNIVEQGIPTTKNQWYISKFGGAQLGGAPVDYATHLVFALILLWSSGHGLLWGVVRIASVSYYSTFCWWHATKVVERMKQIHFW